MFSLNCGTYYLHLFSPANKFSQAIELYSQAIELNSLNAVYWANRAFAHTKLEEYGSAVQDATKAIEIDPRYSKVSDDASATFCLHGLYFLVSAFSEVFFFFFAGLL